MRCTHAAAAPAAVADSNDAAVAWCKSFNVFSTPGSSSNAGQRRTRESFLQLHSNQPELNSRTLIIGNKSTLVREEQPQKHQPSTLVTFPNELRSIWASDEQPRRKLWPMLVRFGATRSTLVSPVQSKQRVPSLKRRLGLRAGARYWEHSPTLAYPHPFPASRAHASSARALRRATFRRRHVVRTKASPGTSCAASASARYRSGSCGRV